jgi:diguanylate cyclase
LSFFKKIPKLIWVLIIICYLTPLLIEDSLLNNPLIEMRWFLYLVPVFFYSYYHGLKVGIIGSFLSNIVFLSYEWFEILEGEHYLPWEQYYISSISVISFLTALGIGIMTNKLNKLNITDPLTNLYNRRYMNDYHIGRKKLSFLFIDLDRFKFINDSLGHRIGDKLLQSVSERLKKQAGAHDIIVRLGGDEFVFVLDNIGSDDVRKKAGEILHVLSLPYFIEGNELFLTASIGISQSPIHGDAVNDLIVKADMAMYKAKQAGKNQYRIYVEEMNEEIIELAELEKGLHRALKQDEFILYYQPKVDLNTGKVIGMEALIRWDHPSRGLIPPIKFIPMAEETGLIIPLGAWVLYTACKQNKEWQDAGFPPLRISVNISPAQFQYHLVSTVENVLKQTGLDPEWIELEITESMLVGNMEEATEIMQTLKKLGVYLSIDDFGKGFSSLNYLKRLPIDCLKMDKAFVDDICSDATLANTIITLGHNMNIEVIAEGIEEQNQAHALLQQNCYFGQGFLFNPPVPKEEFEKKFLGYKLVVSFPENHFVI